MNSYQFGKPCLKVKEDKTGALKTSEGNISHFLR